MTKATLYNMQGEKQKEVELPESVFGLELQPRLIQEVVIAHQANQRQVTAHTKDRGEVSGGGKKPWKQKGTGRARHGSIRSPLWVGGGITFGPRKNRNFTKKVNKKVARKALKMVLSDRAAHGAIALIDSFSTTESKTKNYAKLIKAIGAEKSKRILFITNEINRDMVRCVDNIPHATVMTASDLNAHAVIRTRSVVMEEGCVESLSGRLK